MNTFHQSLVRAVFAALLSLAPLAAQSLSGRVVGPAGQPIAGITVDPGSGSPTATTDANGMFTISPLANDTYDVEYLPAIAAPWAARIVVTNIVGATNVGDVVLQPGFAVSGVARNSAGLGLVGCNVNVYTQSGEKLFTPHDGTDALGNFSVTVPAGVLDVRVMPPVATLLVPQQREDVVVAGAVNLGVVTLPTGHQVTGTVNDQVSLVPIGQTRIKAVDSVTGQRIIVTNDTANTFGQFTLLLPVGMFDLDFEPPVGNTHPGKRKYGVVVTGSASLGQVKLLNGVLASGVVSGPSGPLAGVDIDVHDSFGAKLFTPRDVTGATGAFSVAVPTGAGYRVTFQPPVGLGLVGTRTAPITFAGPTSLGTITLPAGAPVVGQIKGPAGPEANAEVAFVDTTLTDMVTVGNFTDARGAFTTFVTPGLCEIEVRTAEGSYHHGARGQVLVASSQKSLASFTLPAKTLRCTLSALGTPTIAQNGLLAVDLLIDNRTSVAIPVAMDLFVKTTAGLELPVLLDVPLAVPPGQLPLNGLLVQVPVVPTTEVGKVLRLVVRFRAAPTYDVLDSATTAFVVE